ncbi:MAG: hypothetical protein ABJN26_01745 [Stappiaceae bacterium]
MTILNKLPTCRGLILAAALVLVPAIAEAACLSNAQAQQAVASGKALPLGAVRARVNGEILAAKLCESGGRYYYQLTVRSGGKVSKMQVNAQ